MAKFLDVARFTPTAGGTTDWTVSAAVTGYQTPVAAGAVDGINYRYRAESSDLSQWEIGYGASSSTGTVFARTTVLYNSSGTTSKINFSSAPTVGIVPLSIDFREKLDAARTYYVRTDGSDSNTGLANTAGGAFLTVQKAIDVIATFDISAQTVTVQIADGTYTGAISLKNVAGFATPGNLVIQGNNGTPANVLISPATSAFSADSISTVWDIKDLKIVCSTTGSAFALSNGAGIRYGNLNFGAMANGYHVFCNTGGKATSLSSYAVSGGAIAHWYSANTGLINANGITITITGTPAFSSAWAYTFGGTISCFSDTFSGSATGSRYSSNNNGYIFTNGGGATYLPGNAGGTGTNAGTSPFGLYA